MPELADLFPGFSSHWIDTSVGKMFARSGGDGRPLLLLHGYTQTHVMWHRVAPALANTFTLVIPDLPGYGWSAVPEADGDHAPYDKRSMARVMIEIMDANVGLLLLPAFVLAMVAFGRSTAGYRIRLYGAQPSLARARRRLPAASP